LSGALKRKTVDGGDDVPSANAESFESSAVVDFPDFPAHKAIVFVERLDHVEALNKAPHSGGHSLIDLRSLNVRERCLNGFNRRGSELFGRVVLGGE
jgi:hypothetical protein